MPLRFFRVPRVLGRGAGRRPGRPGAVRLDLLHHPVLPEHPGLLGARGGRPHAADDADDPVRRAPRRPAQRPRRLRAADDRRHAAGHVGLLGLAQMDVDTSYNPIWPFFILLGAGIALTMPSAVGARHERRRPDPVGHRLGRDQLVAAGRRRRRHRRAGLDHREGRGRQLARARAPPAALPKGHAAAGAGGRRPDGARRPGGRRRRRPAPPMRSSHGMQVVDVRRRRALPRRRRPGRHRAPGARAPGARRAGARRGPRAGAARSRSERRPRAPSTRRRPAATAGRRRGASGRLRRPAPRRPPAAPRGYHCSVAMPRDGRAVGALGPHAGLGQRPRRRRRRAGSPGAAGARGVARGDDPALVVDERGRARPGGAARGRTGRRAAPRAGRWRRRRGSGRGRSPGRPR